MHSCYYYNALSVYMYVSVFGHLASFPVSIPRAVSFVVKQSLVFHIFKKKKTAMNFTPEVLRVRSDATVELLKAVSKAVSKDVCENADSAVLWCTSS